MRKSPSLRASNLQQSILETIARQVTASVREVEQTKLILAMLAGKSNQQVNQELGYSWEKAKRWRFRWIQIQPGLDTLETTMDPEKVRWELEKAIRDGLSDAPRSGSPGKFSAHDYCQILGVALEEPSLSGRPVSHWGLTELTDEVIKRGIVSRISRSQSDRRCGGFFFKNTARSSPTRPRAVGPPMRLNPKCTPAELALGSEQICQAYLEAPRRWVEEGLKTVSTDEKTGMQALARNAPDLPLQVGQVCRQEYEYTRHGTARAAPFVFNRQLGCL